MNENKVTVDVDPKYKMVDCLVSDKRNEETI